MAIEMLSPEERGILLRIARQAIEHRARTGEIPTREELGLGALPEPLERDQGAFVTLEKRGQLRGCIGYIQPTCPPWEAVVENAVHAAWEDPRFPGVKDDEIPQLEIEVSVIHPMEPIQSPEEIEIGLHGIVIRASGRRGVLLPQVASERGWDAKTFLTQVCHKAGLSPDTWSQPGTDLWRFAAEHFSERTEQAGGAS